MTRPNFIFASYGNDSIALIQWVKEHGERNVSVIYSDTGWAAAWWDERVAQAEEWVKSLGYTPVRIGSIGLETLVKEKKGWPRQGMQFCTHRLKIEPAMKWLEANDPAKTGVCWVGVRREESQARKAFPETIEASPNHGGRMLRAPLATYTTAQRNELLERAGFEPLPHRSMECFPCINSNRADLRLLAKDNARVEQIAALETEMGFTSKGKPRTMFRPYRHMGATGIKQVVAWAVSERGAFDLDDGTGAECDTGYCGT